MSDTCSLSRPFIDDRPWYSSEARMAAPPARKDLRCEPFDDEAVLYDPLSGGTFHLNATALFVWQRCQPDFTLTDIAQALAGRYGISLDRATDDVEQLIALFASHGLLATYDPAGTLM